VRRVLLAVVFACLVFGSTALTAQENRPLLGPRTTAPAAATTPEREPDAIDRTLRALRALQFDTQRRLAGAVRALKNDRAAVWTLLFLSFLYGVLHAVGPGHGKVVIASYLAATRDRLRHGLALSFASSLVQAISAVALVGGLAVILQVSQMQTQANVRVLEIASYALMVAIGLWMTASALRGGRHHHHHHNHHHGLDGAAGLGHGAHDHQNAHHEHALAQRGDEDKSRPGRRRFLALTLAIGIRPCSGAVLVLLFSFAQGLVLAGIGATFVMAAGTALTLCALAALTVVARQTLLRVAEGRRGRAGVWVGRGLAIGGSLAVTGFGVLLLAAALGQPGSVGG